jgi:acyl-CoA dehydrogenase
MFAFEPTEEQQMLIDAIRRYSSNNLRPAAHDADEESQFKPELIDKGWELGFLQASIPEQFGGFGDYSSVTSVLAAEEFAYGDLAGAMAIMTPGLFAFPILLAGSEEQKNKYLPPLVEGEWQPFTAALMEMAYDFDPNDLDTRAVEDGDEYVLNGEKVYVPFAETAPAILVYARLGDQTQGFIVPQGAEGLKVGERQKLLGIHALPVFQVRLENVRVQKADRLGGPEGHSMDRILAVADVTEAALAVGMARASLDYAVDYAKDRDAFGVKVAQKQAIAFMLAEMATEIEAMRLLTWEAAWMLDQNMPQAAHEAYLAKTGAADMVMMVTDRAVQILGGHGYIREHPVEMWMRNGRGIAAFSGLALA